MDPEVVGAIIGAVAVIIAAVIGVKVKSQNKKVNKSAGQTAVAGKNVFQAGGKSSQNVTYTEIHQYPQDIPPHKLLSVVDEVQAFANRVLIENQEILHPVFSKTPDRNKIAADMQRLFNVQRGRAQIGEWRGFLLSYQAAEENPSVQEVVGELIGIMDQLQQTLYAYAEDNFGVDLMDQVNKYLVTQSYGDPKVTIKRIRDISQNYLDHLRMKVQQIGEIKGVLRSMLT